MNERRTAINLGLTWLLVATGLRVTLLAPEVCPPLSADGALAAAGAAAEWIAVNQSPDGTFLYEIDRVTGAPSGGYNLVRHAGTTMSLYQVVRHGDPADADRLLAAADLDEILTSDPRDIAALVVAAGTHADVIPV